MKKRWLMIAGIVALVGVPEAKALIIDDFNFGTMNIVANTLSPATRFIDNGPGILGGERETTVFYTAATSTVPGNVNTRINFLSDGTLLHNQDAGVAGGSVFVYDGSTDVNSPAGLFDVDGTGLGGIDLTADGADRFIFDILFADQSVNNVLDVRVYSDDTHYSDLLKSITSPIASSTLFEFLFSDFTTGAGAAGAADFTNVGAILFLIDGRVELALDLQIDSFTTNGRNQEPVIPEPATIVLLGLGLSAWGMRKKFVKLV